MFFYHEYGGLLQTLPMNQSSECLYRVNDAFSFNEGIFSVGQ